MPDSHSTENRDLAETFDEVVVPEATPSPRTIRFATPPLHTGPSRVYDSGTASGDDDPRVARLFGAFDDVTNVLVGPDFVAVTIERPNRWSTLLGSMLRVVTEEFTGRGAHGASEPPTLARTVARTDSQEQDARAPRRLERAWSELGTLRADQPDQLERVLAAANDAEPARRQVAAALLVDAGPEAAIRAWEALLGDASRAVRRSVVDAVAGTGRQELRPLLEEALDDVDAWIRWKALRGIAELGPEPSRAAIEARAADPDFRVRLEAAQVLNGDVGS
jgi:Scaffold protein Nfu/NifU N terminal